MENDFRDVDDLRRRFKAERRRWNIDQKDVFGDQREVDQKKTQSRVSSFERGRHPRDIEIYENKTREWESRPRTQTETTIHRLVGSAAASEAKADYISGSDTPWPGIEEQIEELLRLIRDPGTTVGDKQTGVQKFFRLHLEIAEAHSALGRIKQA